MGRCICGHSEGDHIRSGGCRAPGCLCERFRPIPEIDWMRREMWASGAHE
jgi:hypothetical protein